MLERLTLLHSNGLCQKIKSITLLYVGEVIVDTYDRFDESNHRGGNRWGYDFAWYLLCRVAICRTCWVLSEYSHSFRISGRLWQAELEWFSPSQKAQFKHSFQFVVFMIVQIVEGNVVHPKVVGSSVGLPTILTPAAALIGGNLFGLVGMIFFIPNFCRDLPFLW